MIKKYSAIAALVMSQLPVVASATDANGIITVTGTVSPISCAIAAPTFNFGTFTFHDITATPNFNRTESSGISITCTDDVRASALRISGTPHSTDRDGEMAIALTSATDGTTYRDGAVKYQMRLHTTNTAQNVALQTILGQTFNLRDWGNFRINNGANLISSTGTGAFGTVPVNIDLLHFLYSEGVENAGIHAMPVGNYQTAMNIALTY